MKPLDVETLLVVTQLLAALICAFTLAGAWRARYRVAMWLWTGAFGVLWLSQLVRLPVMEMWGYRASLPWGHVGGTMYAALILLGTRAFLRLSLHWRRVLAVVGVVAIGSVAVIAYGFSASWSLGCAALASGLLLATSTVDAARGYRRGGHWSLCLIATVLGVSAVIVLIRAGSVLLFGGLPTATNTASGPWLLIMLGAYVAQGFAILLLVNGALEQELRGLADFDPLTGLLNRRGFGSRMARLLQRNRSSPRVALAMIDLDFFKRINDKYGHATGDQVLIEVGCRLQHCSRPGDLIARFGGEEFVLVLIDVNSDLLMRLAERVRAAIGDTPIDTRTGTVAATISVGIAPMQKGESMDALIGRADQALYRAKSEGRDRVVVAN